MLKIGRVQELRQISMFPFLLKCIMAAKMPKAWRVRSTLRYDSLRSNLGANRSLPLSFSYRYLPSFSLFSFFLTVAAIVLFRPCAVANDHEAAR